jgi:hypothetical protein
VANFLWGFLFSGIGAGFFLYGRKQTAVVPLTCGLALMAYPYFVDDVVITVAIGMALVVIPYFVRI